jgi:hypothetical protein
MILKWVKLIISGSFFSYSIQTCLPILTFLVLFLGSSSMTDKQIQDSGIDLIYASPETLVGYPAWRAFLCYFNLPSSYCVKFINHYCCRIQFGQACSPCRISNQCLWWSIYQVDSTVLDLLVIRSWLLHNKRSLSDARSNSFSFASVATATQIILATLPLCSQNATWRSSTANPRFRHASQFSLSLFCF